ncbi:MAG TPA: hypothetical protein VI365_00660, partial [Trebonia sp.]
VKDSSVLESVDPRDYVGDRGFVGNGMITPFKKPAGGELLDCKHSGPPVGVLGNGGFVQDGVTFPLR